MKKKAAAYLMLLVVSIIWGAASPIVKHTLIWFNPWLFLTYRFGISAIVGIVALAITKPKFPKKSSDIGLLLLTGFMSAPLALWLFFESLTKTTALSGSLLASIGPLLLIIGGAVFFHDKIRHNERIGIAVTLIGAAVTIVGPLIFNGQTDHLGKVEGNMLMLLAVSIDMGAALFSTYAMKRKIDPALLTHTQFILGFAIYLPILFMRQSWIDVAESIMYAPIAAHIGVLFMAIASGTIAYTLRNIALKSIEVSESALYTYLQPLWAALLAVLWLGEAVTTSYLIGGAIIAVGVVIAEYRKK